MQAGKAGEGRRRRGEVTRKDLVTWEIVEDGGQNCGRGDAEAGRAGGSAEPRHLCWSLRGWQSETPQQTPSSWVCRQRGGGRPIQPSGRVRTRLFDPRPSARPLGLPWSPRSSALCDKMSSEVSCEDGLQP